MNDTVDYEGRDLETLGNMRRYYAWIVDHFRAHLSGHVIEYGAGTGSISALLAPHAEKLELVEPSPTLQQPLRDRFVIDTSVRVIASTLERHIADQPSASVDTIVLVNVLEHVEKDAWALNEIARVLKPGGHLCLFVPALRTLYSALDRFYGHHRRYHLPELRRLTESAGFTVELGRYIDILGVLPWWALNTLMGKTDFNPKLIGLYDAVGVPITRTLESVVTPPFGKNIVMVARRAAEK